MPFGVVFRLLVLSAIAARRPPEDEEGAVVTAAVAFVLAAVAGVVWRADGATVFSALLATAGALKALAVAVYRFRTRPSG